MNEGEKERKQKRKQRKWPFETWSAVLWAPHVHTHSCNIRNIFEMEIHKNKPKITMRVGCEQREEFLLNNVRQWTRRMQLRNDFKCTQLYISSRHSPLRMFSRLKCVVRCSPTVWSKEAQPFSHQHSLAELIRSIFSAFLWMVRDGLANNYFRPMNECVCVARMCDAKWWKTKWVNWR